MNQKQRHCFSTVNNPARWLWQYPVNGGISFCAGTILLVIALMFTPVCEANSHDIAKDKSHPQIDQFVQNNLGTDWYGIYLQKKKMGYAKMTLRHQQGQAGAFYSVDVEMTMVLHYLGVDIRSKFLMSEQFEAVPPYALTYYLSEQQAQDEMTRVTINRSQNRYEARILQDHETRTKPLEQLRYTLQDALAVELWLQHEPQVGARITFSELNEEKLQMQNTQARIKSIRNTLVDGVSLKYYEIVVSDAEGFEFDSIISASGKFLSMNVGKFLTLQLEPKALATQLDKPVDLFVSHLVKITQTLGNPEKVKRLKLTADGIPADIMKDAPGQRLKHDKKSGLYQIEINPTGDFHVKATAAEIQEALAETVIYPIHHPEVVKLAKQAIGDATTVKDRVTRLIHFVYEYLEDDYHANPLTVMDIITKKKGDCTEYALLFATLARSLGIPSRTVNGLVYMGDKWQAFGLHEWNEVVMNGLWVPVDPAWDEVTINATHIRFPSNMTSEIRMIAVTPDIKFQIQSVELAD